MNVDPTGDSVDARIAAAALSLLCYDLLLTFQQELRGVWWRRFSGATLVFLAIRYTALADTALEMAELAACPRMRIPCSTCNIILALEEGTTALVLVGLASFCALRMYAISAKDYKIAAAVFVLILADACISVYVNNLSYYAPADLPARGCVKTVRGGLHTVRAIADIAGTVCSVLGELILSVVTWQKTAELRRTLAEHELQSPLVALLVRNGIAGFSFLSVCSLVIQAIPGTSGLENLVVPLLSIFVCRFMLLLRCVNLPIDDEDAPGGATALFFAVGDLGALDVRLEDEDVYGDSDESATISDDPLNCSTGPVTLSLGRAYSVGGDV